MKVFEIIDKMNGTKTIVPESIMYDDITDVIFNDSCTGVAYFEDKEYGNVFMAVFNGLQEARLSEKEIWNSGIFTDQKIESKENFNRKFMTAETICAYLEKNPELENKFGYHLQKYHITPMVEDMSDPIETTFTLSTPMKIDNCVDSEEFDWRRTKELCKEYFEIATYKVMHRISDELGDDYEDIKLETYKSEYPGYQNIIGADGDDVIFHINVNISESHRNIRFRLLDCEMREVYAFYPDGAEAEHNYPAYHYHITEDDNPNYDKIAEMAMECVRYFDNLEAQRRADSYAAEASSNDTVEDDDDEMVRKESVEDDNEDDEDDEPIVEEVIINENPKEIFINAFGDYVKNHGPLFKVEFHAVNTNFSYGEFYDSSSKIMIVIAETAEQLWDRIKNKCVDECFFGAFDKYSTELEHMMQTYHMETYQQCDDSVTLYGEMKVKRCRDEISEFHVFVDSVELDATHPVLDVASEGY